MYRKSCDFLYSVQQLRDYVQLFSVHFFILYTFRFLMKCTRISLDSCTMYRNINKNRVFFVQCTSFFRTFLRMYRISFIRNVQKLCTDISVQCTRNEQKRRFFFLYNVQEFGWIPVHLLVHFVILEILVHFYPISIGVKQTRFWYFSRSHPSPRDYTCNSCAENYWGVRVGAAMNHCEGDEAEDRFSSCRGYQWICAVRTKSWL